MAKIILHPYAATLLNGNRNPKNYPWWSQVVAKLNELGHEIIQIGVAGETRIEGVSQFIQNWPLSKLRDLINSCDTWMAVDSFLPHYCFTEKLKRGVVVWSLSSPEIWGHPDNINLLKDRKYLRELQYKDWHDVEYNEDAFVSPDEVVEAVQSLVSRVSNAVVAQV